MRERPILFSGPMVRALLDDSKTQTRRVCNPAQAHALSFVVELPDPQERGQVYNRSHFGDEEGGIQFACPYGGQGERLWVRETFWAWGRWETRFSAKKRRDEWHFVDMTLEWGKSYRYDADGFDGEGKRGYRQGNTPAWFRRPGIFMPREACRLLLEVNDVRVERLQAITDADSLAEGVDRTNTSIPGYAKERFHRLWESINGAESWAANPWVWAVSFKRVQP